MVEQMDCQEALNFIDVYIDDEFDAGERAEMELHLVGCEACRAAVSTEREFRLTVRSRLAPTPAPSHLRDNVLRQIAVEAQERQKTENVLPQVIQWAVPLALAASIALVAIWPFGTPDLSMLNGGSASSGPVIQLGLVPGTAPKRPAAPRVVADPTSGNMRMATYARLPADVTGNSREISTYMTGKVGFRVSPPFESADGMNLVGARQVVAEDRPAVLFIYEVDGERVNVVSLPALPGGDASELKIERCGAMTCARLAHKDTDLVVVTPLGPHELGLLLDRLTRLR